MSGNVVPLSSIIRSLPVPPTGGCASSSCGAPSDRGDVPEHVWDRIKDHPCFSEEAHHYFARMHVAVAPACNIQCNYCNRKYDCANESRPGVTSERLTPEQAARKVMAVAAKVPQLSVLGIAGPGDSMFDWRRTFETFRLVSAQLPDLKFCVSTNGLALPDHVDELAEHNIDHVTITINAVDPEIATQIYPWIYFNGRRHTGIEAARILLARQMEGLERLTAKGVLVKVNSVLIPGINDRHLVEVNAAIKARGAFLHNVMPLISDPSHGTRFGLDGRRGPTPAEVKAVQDSLGGGAHLMRHCRQCRADAVGMLGEDLSRDFTLDKIPEAPVVDPEPRRVYREVVARERADRARAVASAVAGLAKTAPAAAPARLVAVCTKGGGRINQHFGHAREFHVFEVDALGVRFSGLRKADNYCLGGEGDDERMPTILAALEGIETVFMSKIGRCPRNDLAKAGIEAVDTHPFEYIESAVAAWYAERFGVQIEAASIA
ncbi:nitrogenase cofactor biosynthesis protein NifB [Magnetospirillum molischianum]|uniref:FeMo cofactor biosynthesis protein NifB n=1 Tax=Magnetospirillum molischianum DSM 120 TaxID=1150626 RepID=H8FMN4_MAGML|nr:nitrogenase cofactor biosynthesis protein NifB [Magnetospirillum molischianum]CCG39622.1 Nitrogenase FeMo cofactor biosynthesis protein NifB [Magnetospirillum molischianum DSM 120]